MNILFLEFFLDDYLAFHDSEKLSAVSFVCVLVLQDLLT